VNTVRDSASIVVVAAVMYGIAVGGWPGLAVNRTTLTVIGAVLLLAMGSLPLAAAWQAVDIATLVILMGMMIINGQLEAAGFFDYAAYHITRWADHAKTLLLLVMLISAVLSALFLNDTVVFLLTPLVIIIARHTGTPPIPLLLGIATSANIGSAATITGNPQNIVIGTLSQIGFLPFVAQLWLLCVIALLVAWVVICASYWHALGRLTHTSTMQLPAFHAPHALIAISILVVGLASGLDPALAVALAAASLLLRRHTSAETLIAPIDGSLLLFFAALFVVTAALHHSPLAQSGVQWAQSLIAGRIDRLTIVTAVLSNLISNVPAVLVLQHVIASFAQHTTAWLVLAASSTFAGNSTLLASIANLIVAERAAAHGVTLTFGTYMRVGLPITFITLALTIWWFA
jgi:Na+/H+ antiporter NhaD/arsenite permease-like protein